MKTSAFSAMMDAVTMGKLEGRRDLSVIGNMSSFTPESVYAILAEAWRELKECCCARRLGISKITARDRAFTMIGSNLNLDSQR